MSRIALFPSADADRLWDRYSALARAVATDPTKLVDRDHMQAMALAHEEWRVAFLAGERRA